MDVQKRDAMETTARKAPVTLERPVQHRELSNLSQPHVPRALHAVDNEHPQGSPGHDHKNMSVLQQHVAFFDRNGDGIVYPWETYQGFRAIGFNVVLSFIAVLFINLSMSYGTLESWIPSPLFPIYVKNIHKAKHGSDSGVYDHEGRFMPGQFEVIWDKYAKTHPDRMSLKELFAMTECTRMAYDIFGWIASKLEWFATWWVLHDEKGFVSKDAVRGVYDGSIFEYMERKNRERKKKAH